MIKVVFQDVGYWLRLDFWREAEESGVDPILVERRNGVATSRSIGRIEFSTRTGTRVAGWSFSVDKTISVLMASVSPENRAKVIGHFQAAVRTGLEEVANRFTARTGAQGKVRLPAEVGFVVVVHTEAKNGAPQLHAHIAIEERVRVPGRVQTYATHTRELYQLRRLVNAAVTQELAARLRVDFGVRVEKTRHGVRLPDVPRALCRLSSDRVRQIDGYIAKQGLPNTPLARRYAALVTRRDNPNRTVGREAFRAELVRTGFRGESICQSRSKDPNVSLTPPTLENETRRVGEAARRLALLNVSITHSKLLARALETAAAGEPVPTVVQAAKAVLQNPARFGLSQNANAGGSAAETYQSNDPLKSWKPIRDRLDYLFAERERAQSQMKPDGRERSQIRLEGVSAGSGKKADSGQSQAGEAQEQKTDSKADRTKSFEKVLRSYRVIGAVGHFGLDVAAKAAELYRVWAKPIWRVQGAGNKNTPGSVAAMVRDLKKLPFLESHQNALAAMLKLNGSLDQKLRYGERVYRQSRQPKFRIPKKSLIIIRDVEAAKPRDVQFILAKAERAKARVLLVEREWSRSVLVGHAATMRPGECRRIREPEQKR